MPYLLGFQPTNSLVLLAFHGKRVIFQARVDLPPPDEVDDLARYLAEITARSLPAREAVERDGPVEIALVGYGTAAKFLRWPTRCTANSRGAACRCVDMLRVDDGRYWNLLCDDPGCCPPEGVPFDPGATACRGGRDVRRPRRRIPIGRRSRQPSIRSRARASSRRSPRALERLGRLSGGQRGLKAAARAAVRQAFERYMNGGRLDDDEVAWLAVLLADVLHPRRHVGRASLSGPTVPEHEEIWRDVVRRVPLRYVPAPATLLALVGVAVRRRRPGRRRRRARAGGRPGRTALADLLLHALRRGLPPTALDDMPPAPAPPAAGTPPQRGGVTTRGARRCRR